MFNEKEIGFIIATDYQDFSGEEIAKHLNDAKFTTKNGKKWTQANVSFYALKVLGLDRKHKEFTKSVAQKQDTILTQEVKTENLTQINAQDKTALIETAVFEKDGKFFTDSLKISEIFDREHKNILAAIDTLECSLNFRQLNFKPSYYFNSQNKSMPKFELTKDGFSFLVMGFTGSKASEFKEKFIERFNELENQVKQAPPKVMTLTEQLLLQAQIMDQQSKKIDLLDNNVNLLSEKIINIESRKKQIENDLELLPEPQVLPLQRTDRINFVEAVKAYSTANYIEPRLVYNRVYKEFGLRYHMDVQARSDKQKISKLDYIESISKVDVLYALTCELFQLKKVGS